MNETAIAWTDLTWNPASGCAKISLGCKHCYAESLAEQKRGTRAFPNGFDLTVRRHKLDEVRRVKRPSLIFVNSMSDLFWDRFPADLRDEAFDVMEAHPQHVFQLLTKRPAAMAAYSQTRPFARHIWAGATVEHGDTMGRLAQLRSVRAETRFISAEPMLGPLPGLDLAGISWVIVGGESGSHLSDPAIMSARGMVERVNGRWAPRPDRAQWVRDVRDACYEHGSAFFFKQWGGPTPKSGGDLLDGDRYNEFPWLPEGRIQ